MTILDVIHSRRTILCVGSGGVGKTTTAAAIGLLAAMQGRRALCLTIDPARRLAQSLGLEELCSDAQDVPREKFAQAGLDVSGSLTMMMLNTKRTFDDVVERHAPSPEVRDRIMQNRAYHYVSTTLAGTHEYMAMEKLYEVRSSSLYDTIVLDTPPTSNALSFLDAPDRMIEALDSSAVRWFTRAFRPTQGLSLDLLARSAALGLRGLSRFTGMELLEHFGGFLTEFTGLFTGFAQRAREVRRALRASDVAYVMVTSPDPMAIREALYFSERLTEMGMASDAFVINRLHRPVTALPTEQVIRDSVLRSGLFFDDDIVPRLQSAIQDAITLATTDAHNLRVLDDALLLTNPRPLRVVVPAYPSYVHDIEALHEVAGALAAS